MLTLPQVVSWLKGVELYSRKEYDDALKQFNQLINAPNYSGEVSKLAHNIAAVYYQMEDHDRASKWLVSALQKDPYLCISHFLFGQVLFEQEKYAEAAKEWDKCLEYMRGNTWINYKPLGLNFMLYSCEVMFNKSMATIYSGEILPGVAQLERSGREYKWTHDHERIDKAYAYFNAIKHSLHSAVITQRQTPPVAAPKQQRPQRANTVNVSRSKSLARSKSVKHKQQQLQDNIRNRSSMGFGGSYTNTFDVSLLPQRSQEGTKPKTHSPLARSQTIGGGNIHSTRNATEDTVDLPTTVKMAKSSPTYKTFQVPSNNLLFSIHDNRLKNIVGCEHMASLLCGKDEEFSNGAQVSSPQDNDTEFSFVESVSVGRSEPDMYDIDDYYHTNPSSTNSLSSCGSITASPPRRTIIKPAPVDLELANQLRTVSLDSSLATPKLNKLVESIHKGVVDREPHSHAVQASTTSKHRVQINYIQPITAKACSFIDCSSPDTPVTPMGTQTVCPSPFENETVTWNRSLSEQTDLKLRELREFDRQEIRALEDDSTSSPALHTPHIFDPQNTVNPAEQNPSQKSRSRSPVSFPRLQVV